MEKIASTRRQIYLMTLALLLSTIGASIKLYGGIVYQSKAVVIDGITCIANLGSGLVILSSMVLSRRPPDIDHPYGHHRVIYSGILVLLLSYAFSAGLSIGVLIQGQKYMVRPESALFALLGSAFYAFSILVVKGSSKGGESYAFFTISEVLEGLVSASAAYAGAEIDYLIDYIGAILITAYIFVEIYKESRTLNTLITDRIQPAIYQEINKLLKERGFKVKRLRLRPFDINNYIGDAIVEAPGLPSDVADLLAEEAVYYARKLGVDLTIHIDTVQTP